jgi:hypothetical protein
MDDEASQPIWKAAVEDINKPSWLTRESMQRHRALPLLYNAGLSLSDAHKVSDLSCGISLLVREHKTWAELCVDNTG